MALATLAACAGRQAPPPSPDEPQPRPPDMSGVRVMLLPAQPAPGAGPGMAVPGLDEEIAFWLAESAPRVDWILPPAIQRALERSPSLSIRLDALAVSAFHAAQVRNIGDPLFGDLRALNALIDARYALIPVAAAWVPDSAGGGGRVEMNVALIDTMGGRVLWYGAVAGDTGPAGAPEVTASAGRALARLLAR
jgi:hypothetical protein